MKTFILFLAFVSSVFCAELDPSLLLSPEKKPFRLYTKAGVEVLYTLPTVGGGCRYRDQKLGWDASITYINGNVHLGYFGSKKISALSGKLLALYYPRNKSLYLGLGTGGVSEMPWGGYMTDSFITCEQVIGYEFAISKSLSSFIQVELTEGFAPGLMPITPNLSCGVAF